MSIRQEIKTRYLVEGVSLAELSNEYSIPLEVLQKELGKFEHRMPSKSAESLLKILAKIYKSAKIETEYQMGNLFIDFYIPSIRLAIEYNGIQHYKKSDFYHGKGDSGKVKFELQQVNDGRKADMCKKQNIYMISIPYTTDLTEENIRKIIDEHSKAIVKNLEEYTEQFRVW